MSIYLDWVGDVEIKKLTSGYVFTLGISPMTWYQNDNPQLFFHVQKQNIATLQMELKKQGGDEGWNRR